MRMMFNAHEDLNLKKSMQAVCKITQAASSYTNR